MKEHLFIVATPIGNLDDITFRAQKILKEVDWIAAEDTRHTIKLLSAMGIQKELISFHEHSSEQKIQALIGRLKNGERGAYVSDAGTPCISDPGADLVSAAWREGLIVSPIPGASAITALLSASGFTGTFKFSGFFPREKKEREAICNELRANGGVYVFYESPHRVREFCEWMREKFSNEQLVMGRELTKRYEEIIVGTVEEVCEKIQSKDEILGEFVFALKLPEADKKEQIPQVDIPKLLTELHDLGANQKILVAAAKNLGMKRSEAYELALEIMKKREA